ncbi:hypothetical protein LTS18_004387, partial [Coniosporium uncinatum]
ILRNVRVALFPNNSLAPGRPAPSPTEALIIKRRCAQRIWNTLPPLVAKVYFPGGVGEVERMLGLLDDAYLTKHLVFSIVEVLVVRLIPELGIKGVEELFVERVGESAALE